MDPKASIFVSPPTPLFIHSWSPYSVHRHSNGIYISLQSRGKLTSIHTDTGFSSARWAGLPLLPCHWPQCGHMSWRDRLKCWQSSPKALLCRPSLLTLSFVHMNVKFSVGETESLYQAVVGACLGYSITVMFRELPDSTGSECLGSMTPETQDIYLRMDHHRRRSGYRLGRIIARQQLLKKIAGGRRGDSSDF